MRKRKFLLQPYVIVIQFHLCQNISKKYFEKGEKPVENNQIQK
jgi:hypothetical protein